MKNWMAALGLLFILTGCSSANLGLEDLKETYPETFAAPIESLEAEKVEKIGLPDDIPFDVASVEAEVEDNTLHVLYEGEGNRQVLVTTIYDPGNNLEEAEWHIPLNNGALAGVSAEEDQVFIEWYNGDDDVIYQVQYVNTNSEDIQAEAIEIANSI
jgi:hypothetical protein